MPVFDKERLAKKTEEIGKRHTIMIVDDEYSHLHSMESLLSEDYHIITAADGMEALALIQKMDQPQNISVVISDHRMPGISGVQLLEKLKEIIPDTLRIILTAYDDKADIIDAINKAKIYEFILKPFDPEDLKLRVKRAVEAFDRQQELDDHRQNLKKKVAEKTKELEERTKDLENANTEKNVLFSIIAHDLLKSYTDVFGTFNLLFNKYDSHSENKKRVYIKEINKNREDLSNIIVKLTNWAWIQMNELEYNPSEVKIDSLITKSISALQAHANQKQIDLTWQAEPGITAFVDEDAILFAFKNLISNSIKFTNPGGWVKVSASPVQTGVEIFFCDNGIGMYPETISMLYTIGVNKSRPGTDQEKGICLGLIICKKLIERNKGTIEIVNSSPFNGTCFMVNLPLKEIDEQKKTLQGEVHL